MNSLKHYQKLHLKKYRQEWQLFIVEGKRLCREALQSGWEIQSAFTSQDFTNDPDWQFFREKLNEHHTPFISLRANDFKKLADTENPQGILFILKIRSEESGPGISPASHDIILLLDGIRDPGNMGTIIRTADWFGIPLIFCSSDSVDYYNLKTLRATMGSIFNVPCRETTDLAETMRRLKEKSYSLIGTSPAASMALKNLNIKLPVALVLGGEAEGISPGVREMLDFTITIPRQGKAESLNVSIAAGILMNDLITLLRP